MFSSLLYLPMIIAVISWTVWDILSKTCQISFSLLQTHGHGTPKGSHTGSVLLCLCPKFFQAHIILFSASFFHFFLCAKNENSLPFLLRYLSPYITRKALFNIMKIGRREQWLHSLSCNSFIILLNLKQRQPARKHFVIALATLWLID